MDDGFYDLQIIKEELKKYGQEHLLYFYNELNEQEKNILINQIKNTDFNFLNNLYVNSYRDETIDSSRITPIEYYVKNSISEEDYNLFNKIGENIIKEGKIAIITLAGGMGSRLGYKGPKGCYEIDIPPKKSLFEFICDELKEIRKKYGVYLKWYIMTSPSNDEETRNYFERHHYFGYDENKIFFFKQNTICLLDINGKILLENEYTLKMDSNGNGDIFKSFVDNNMLETADEIEWFSISGIDNIILEIIDPILIGLTCYNNSNVSSKSVNKQNLAGKEWVFAKVDDEPSIIDPENLNIEMIQSEKYNQINILSHLFSKDAFLKCYNIDIRYHRNYKKNDFLNEEGMKVVATTPNSFKFEKFIFDVFPYFDNFTLLEVDADKEFAPIKSFNGEFTPETALEKYIKKKRV